MTQLREIWLPDGCSLLLSELPPHLVWDDATFAEVWDLHPAERHVVCMFGRALAVPRWQQAYGADYQYTGSRNNALQLPVVLCPLLTWARESVDGQLNGLLVN